MTNQHMPGQGHSRPVTVPHVFVPGQGWRPCYARAATPEEAAAGALARPAGAGPPTIVGYIDETGALREAIPAVRAAWDPFELAKWAYDPGNYR